MTTTAILIYLSCFILLFLIGKVLYIPLKHVVKVLVNSILGGILIVILNFFGASFGVHIVLNIGTALMVGILGVPGAILLIILSVF